MKFSVKKAVFPVAGMGIRFLPATKASPKEMLPVVDKPLIQYAVEEAIKAGLTEMIFVTSGHKRDIEDHFDGYYELERKLLEQGKKKLYDTLQSIAPPGIHFAYVRQREALGLGHALLCAKHVVGQEPFAVLLADDLIDESKTPCLSAMVKQYEQTGHSCMAVQQVPDKDVSKYGIVDVENASNARTVPIKAIIEKPTLEKAFSNFASIGRYLFAPEIFDSIEKTPPDHSNEIQLTGAISELIQQQPVDAFFFHGQRYDCGSKLGYMKANVDYALKHPEIGEAFREEMRLLARTI
jgi:UTP--glucose-1-phosphate uridylyltransferase